MMKLKKWLTSKSLLTFISILSVLLLFSVLCGVPLAILHSLGVVEFPSDGKEGAISPGANAEAPEIPIYTNAPPAVFGAQGDAIYENLLMEMPFIDQYYIKAHVKSTAEENLPASGIYEIWRYGEKYRIHRYNEQEEVEFVMICDGERVQVTDFSSVTITYAEYSEALAFSAVAPIPNFRKLLTESHEITDILEVGDTCTISCEYPAKGISDTIEFSKSMGMILYYKRLAGERMLLSVDVRSADTNFMFDDYMFMFD